MNTQKIRPYIWLRCLRFALVITVSFGTLLCVHAAGTTPSEQEDLSTYQRFVNSQKIYLSLLNNAKDDRDTQNLIQASITGEAAIITLGKRQSKTSLQALAYISLLGLDGALAQEHTCVVSKKGKAIIPFLEEAINTYKTGKCVLPKSEVVLAKGQCGDPEATLARINRLIEIAQSENPLQYCN